MRTNNYGYFIKACFLSLALSVSGAIHAADDDEIIEFQGDRYVIHVDRMNPDGEMTLMDVLNTCPEFLSINGKKIDQDYKLRTDNIDLVMDAESFFTFLVAGFTKSALISLAFGIVALFLQLMFFRRRHLIRHNQGN